MSGDALRWRIRSDGLPSGTTVHVGDVDVSSTVAAVSFRLDAASVADVRVEVRGIDVDLDVDLPELPTLTVPVEAPAPAPEPIEAPPNRHLVGGLGQSVVVPLAVVGNLTPREAAEAAAWLSVMAEAVDPSIDFDAIRAAVRSS